jgi:tetratricopeptide (TPR) repeat protein
MNRTLLTVFAIALVAATVLAQQDQATSPPPASAASPEQLLSPEQKAQAQFDLGVQYLRDRKYASAVEAFEKAVAGKQDFAEAYSNWAIALVQLGKRSLNAEQQVQFYQNAAEKFSKAASLKPDTALTYVMWSETLVLLGDLPLERRLQLACYQGAVEKCRKAVELSPTQWEAYNKWAVILSSKLAAFSVDDKARYQLLTDAAGLFQKAAEQARYSGEVGPVYANWASALVQAARATPDQQKKQSLLRDALDKFERAARAVPNAAGTYAMWGSALVEVGKLSRQRGDFRDGIDKLNTSLGLNPNDAAAQYNLACAYALMDNQVLAVQALKKCFELDKTFTYRNAAPQDADLTSLRGFPEFEELYSPGGKRGAPTFNPPLRDSPR